MDHDTQTHSEHGPGESAAVPVLFVAGTGRSGSTLVSNLLGSVPGLVSLGEVRYLWERGILENGSCGCGEVFAQCPFWLGVLDRAGPTDPVRMVGADRDLLRVRSLPLLLRAHGDPAQLGTEAVAYAAEIARVYRAIHVESGGAVIVDSSKLVSYGHLLSHVPGLDVRVLHLIRDPRGSAYSWSKQRARTDRGSSAAAMAQETPAKSAALWDLWNGTADRLWSGDPSRYVRVRYEDVVADPQAALAPALALFGEISGVVPVSADGAVSIAISHTVAGNPSRMHFGDIRLEPDNAWTVHLPTSSKVLVTGATAPLLARFGYPLTKPHEPDAQVSVPGRHEFLEDLPPMRRTVARVRRNAYWVRTQGLGRVLEEKDIDPVRTLPSAVRTWSYARSHPHAVGHARPVYLLGVQRSGTNMLVRGLGTAPEVEVHNENDRAAFDRYKLRPDPVIEDIIAASRHTHVLFKPLCDSHRAPHLLDSIAAAVAPRAIWAYRDVDGRVRSALAKFGDGNLQVLREFADGTNTTRWHVARIAPDTADLVRSFDYDTLTPESGAALMWYVRNRLYFDLALDARDDVYLASYNDFLADPARTMRPLAAFLGFPYRDALVAHVSARPPTHQAALAIDPDIRAACDDLTKRLAAAAG